MFALVRRQPAQSAKSAAQRTSFLDILWQRVPAIGGHRCVQPLVFAVLVLPTAAACERGRACEFTSDVDLAPYYPELAGDAGTARASSQATEERRARGLPDDAQVFLAQPCEKSCDAFAYHGNYESESVTGCRVPAKNDAGAFELHCEFRLNGSCGGLQPKLP